MAVLYLHKRIGTISNRYAVFPDDYEVCGHTIVDWWVLDTPEIVGRIWVVLDRPSSRTRYALSYRRADAGSKRPFVGDLLHRVIWCDAYGPVPGGHELDHVNQNGLDNRLENLRLVDHKTNGWNAPKFNGTRFCYKGVDVKVTSSGRIRFQSYTSHDRKKIHVGNFDSIDEAGFAFNVSIDLMRDTLAFRNQIPPDSVSLNRQQEIRSIVEQKLRSRGLIQTT